MVAWRVRQQNVSMCSQPWSLELFQTGRNDIEAPSKTSSAYWPSSSTDTTSFSFTYSSAATAQCTSHFFDKLKLKSSKARFLLWSDYRKYLLGQIMRIHLKTEKNCHLFWEFFFCSTIMNDFTTTFTSRLNMDAKCANQQWNWISMGGCEKSFENHRSKGAHDVRTEFFWRCTEMLYKQQRFFCCFFFKQ